MDCFFSGVSRHLRSRPPGSTSTGRRAIAEPLASNPGRPLQQIHTPSDCLECIAWRVMLAIRAEPPAAAPAVAGRPERGVRPHSLP